MKKGSEASPHCKRDKLEPDASHWIDGLGGSFFVDQLAAIFRRILAWMTSAVTSKRIMPVEIQKRAQASRQ
jgi:hypothetical protein